MLYPNQALPRLRVRNICGEHLPVQATRLVQTICRLQETRILQLCLNLQSLRASREREIERALQHPLRIGVASYRRVGRRQRA